MGRVAKTDMAILDSNISVSTILPEKLPIIRDQTDLSISTTGVARIEDAIPIRAFMRKSSPKKWL